MTMHLSEAIKAAINGNETLLRQTPEGRHFLAKLKWENRMEQRQFKRLRNIMAKQAWESIDKIKMEALLK